MSNYIVHDGLIDEPNIGNPLLEVLERIVNVRAHSLNDEASIGAKYVI